MDIYNVLKSRIEEYGIEVLPCEAGMLGNYYHSEDSTIHMLDHDVFALAHELGHHIVWKSSPRWAKQRCDLLFDISEGFIPLSEFKEWEKKDESLAWAVAYLMLRKVFGDDFKEKEVIQEFQNSVTTLLGSYGVEDTDIVLPMSVLKFTLCESELGRVFCEVQKI